MGAGTDMNRTENLRIEGFDPLITPKQLKHVVPLTAEAGDMVARGRAAIIDILEHRSQRFLIVVGPCSIHDPVGAMDYARRLRDLSETVSDRILVLMRVYFEKPRTSVGWKGLINDPDLNDTHDIAKGLRRAREILAAVTALGLPTACEMLDPITPHYLADLICWGAIGARTTESQTHREMASGLSFPVGFKNGTDGGLMIAVNAMRAALRPHRFLGINADGISCVVRTTGNPHVHVVLRGGERGPNYEEFFVLETARILDRCGLAPRIMVDCSHANSMREPRRQEQVFANVMAQVAGGNRTLFGAMFESYLEEGRQPVGSDPTLLRYGVSITDPCVDWTTTERMIRAAYASLSLHRG